jgi:hypothetical protein
MSYLLLTNTAAAVCFRYTAVRNTHFLFYIILHMYNFFSALPWRIRHVYFRRSDFFLACLWHEYFLEIPGNSVRIQLLSYPFCDSAIRFTRNCDVTIDSISLACNLFMAKRTCSRTAHGQIKEVLQANLNYCIVFIVHTY